MNIKILLLVFSSVFIISCKNQVNIVEKKNNSIVIDTHTSKNTLDWQGTYKGVLPCADCDGIETSIILNDDNTFILTTRYLGRGDGKIFEQKGTFSWDNTGGIITFSGLIEKPYMYKVGENTLQQLDLHGQPISGKLASMYILKK